MRSLLLALLAALAAPATAQQVHPPQYAGTAGNAAEWVDGSFMRDRAGTTVDDFQPQTVRGIAFRAAFRDTRPATYGSFPACTMDVSVRMSQGVAPAVAVGTKLDQHNGTAQDVLPRMLVSFPAAAPSFPGGGLDAWFAEPFLYRFVFATPFAVTAKTSVHYTLTLHSPTRGWPQWDALHVDYMRPQSVPHPSAEYGSNSVFWSTVCNGYVPQVAETGFMYSPPLGGPQILTVDLRGRQPWETTVVLMSFGFGSGAAFPTVQGWCVTMIDLSAFIAVPAHGTWFASWPFPMTPLGQHLVTHRLVFDAQGQVLESGGTHAHRSLNDWHGGRVPNARSQFSWLGVHPEQWTALVTEFF